MTRAMHNGWGVMAAMLAASAGAGEHPPDLAAQVESFSKQVEQARNRIDLVEKQYTLREEPSDEAARLQRFSSAEIQYLLGDYTAASVLFYDLVASREFQASPRYADALFYLADSLYQQKNYLGARLYLKQLLLLQHTHYQEGLARYLEIAGRLNEFSGIDDFVDQARTMSGGQLPAQLTYAYGKWLYRRSDLPLEDRIHRGQQIFATLASDAQGPYRAQAAFFVGVGHVRLKAWDQAIAQFRLVAEAPGAPRDTREQQVRELAELSLGRVCFEIGRYDEAVDHYAHIPQQSESFPDALYEASWAYVRKGELEKAKNATEVLLLVAENSILAPEAKILQGTLLQKMTQYDDAIETYTQVINTYAPVRDEIDALLAVHQDPVKYFDELLARHETTLDVTKLLPPMALKWATTRQEVADAMEITSALDLGRKAIDDSRAIADRILKSLDEHGLESFPLLQEGATQADAVDTTLTRVDDGLTAVRTTLVGPALNADQAQTMAELKARAAALQQRIATLPTNTAELKERRDRMQAQIDGIDRQVFQLDVEAQAQEAQLVAIRKYVEDTRAQRHNTPDDERAFLEKVALEQRASESLRTDLEALRARLLEERSNADKAVGGEGLLRQEYEVLLGQQRELADAQRAQLAPEAQKLLLRADVVHADAHAIQERVARAKAVIRERVARRAEKLRAEVLSEQRLLEGYTRETQAAAGDTRNLVGRIAFDSFKRVRQSFYELVLKADVGVVDVAFQRKQDKTAQIQKLSTQKEREIKGLDEEYREVLKDVD